MMKKTLKCFLGLIASGVLLSISLTIMAKETITPSEKNYGVELQGARNFYLCNKEAVELKKGTKFFITYTVSELESDLSKQSGVIITKDASLDYPYEQGTMQYLQSSVLLKKGATYF